MPNNKWYDPHKRLTITTLKVAVNQNRIDHIRYSLNKYGLPKRIGSKTTDYLVLQIAVQKKRTKIAKLLINAGCRVNRQDDYDNNNYTPLVQAILHENEEIVKLLLKKGAEIDTDDNDTGTVIHLAAQIGSLKMLKRLLSNEKFSVDLKSNDKTPFQVFIENQPNIHTNRNCDIVRLFLKKNASMNFTTSDGQTVLHHVAKTRQNDIITRVLRVTDEVNGQDEEGCTALHNLLNYSKIRNDESEDKVVKMTKKFLTKGANINIQDKSGDTVCHVAAHRKYLRVLQTFLKNQFDVNCSNQEGNSILHCILMNSENFVNESKYVRVVNQILKQDSLEFLKNKDGQNPLHIAAENLQTTILKTIFSKPFSVDINEKDDHGNTALNIYMFNWVDGKKVIPDQKSVALIKKMISRGAIPSICHSESEQTPLHHALKLGNREIILVMLESLCNFNFDQFDEKNNRSILHCLCNRKLKCTDLEDFVNAEIANRCIEKGATIDIRDSELKTPLYWAVLMRQKHMIDVLLDHNANPNMLDDKGGTILENLMKREVDVVDNKYSKLNLPQDIKIDSEIAQMLLNNGAIAENISNGQVSIFHYCITNSHLDMLHQIIPYTKDANICDSSQNTILHALLISNLDKDEQVKNKVAEISTILVSKGADITAINEKGETPLHVALKGKHLKVSQLLLEQNATITDLDNDGNTVFHFLCMQAETNDLEQRQAELFVKKGCDVNAKNNKGMTPVLFAAQSGSLSMMKILRTLNAKIDCVEDENLSMPIHLAAEYNHRMVVKMLIPWLKRCDIDVNVRRKDGKTALHLSVAHKLTGVTRLLLENGALVDLKDSEGKTPLYWACFYESLKNITELLEYGADVNEEDNFYITPLMVSHKSLKAFKLLRCHVIKLELTNMPISNRNRSYMENYNEQDKEMKKFKKSAIEEILEVKEFVIAPSMSLTDVLLMSVNQLCIFKNNKNFQKLLNTFSFKTKFPIFYDLIRASYRKGLIRSNLISSAKVGFSNISGRLLPNPCCDAIFNNLSNENLHNLDVATRIIRIRKRKNLNEINRGPPPKKLKLVGDKS